MVVVHNVVELVSSVDTTIAIHPEMDIIFIPIEVRSTFAPLGDIAAIKPLMVDLVLDVLVYRSVLR